MVKLLLIDMPFSAPLIPSIGLGCIETWIKQNNSDVKIDIFYAKFILLEQIGIELYDEIFSHGSLSISVLKAMFELGFKEDFAKLNRYTTRYPLLIGDLIFSDYYGKSNSEYSFLDKEQNQKIAYIKEKIPAFLKKCEEYILEYRPDMIGFTSMFEQHMAALCLAKRMSLILPECQIIFGGANCEGIMGEFLATKYSFIHTVILGEGEMAMDNLIKEYLSSGNIDIYKGIVKGESLKSLENILPCNYDSFFEQLYSYDIKIDNLYSPIIPINLSRGCWWGEKNKCTFCGQNGSNIHYRCKKVKNALFELSQYHKQYSDYPILVSDNILDNSLLRTGLRDSHNTNYGHVFCEVKANIDQRDLVTLKRTGFDIIQPGIESLNTSSLKRMNKGLTMLQVIRFLRNCEETQVRPIWNYLYGFPGEQISEYTNTIPIIKKIYHLRPPLGSGIIELHRFSEYFDSADKYSIENIRPYFMYSKVYKDYTDRELNCIAYCFDYELNNRLNEEVYNAFSQELQSWKRAYEYSFIKFNHGEQIIIDGRLKEVRTIPLNDVHMHILDCCCEIVSIVNIYDTLEGLYLKSDIDAGIRYLLNNDILIGENNKLLSIVWREADESVLS